MADEFNLQLSAGLDQNKSKSNINSDLTEIAKAIEKLKVQAEIDPNSVKAIANQLAKIVNQKVVIDNVQIDATQVSKSGAQVGQNLGDSINKNLKSSLSTVKQTINDTIKSFSNQKLNSSELTKMFNLNRANIDSSVIQQVKNLTNELNSLSKEVLKTNSDSSWEGIVAKLSSLSNVLNKFGATRDLTGFKESLDVLDYFQNKKIFVGNKSDVLANTGLSIKELNNQFRNLGVTFTTVSESSTKLDTIWTELFNLSPNLQQYTNFGDQINAIVSHLKTAKEALYGDSTLKPLNGNEVNKVLLEYMSNLTDASTKVNGLRQEQSNLEQAIAQASNSSTATVVQNEQKKQQAYEQTNKVQKALTSEESVIKSGVGVRTFDSVKEAQEYFKGLLKDEQAVIATTERFGQNNNLTSFTVNIKRATGEVESLRYAVDALKDDEGNIERIFYRLNGSVTGDSGAIKQIKDIENAFSDYTAKLSQFKSTNSEILSGLTTPLSDFESKLAGLKNGTSTIDEVTNAYKSLNAEASNITKNFSRQLSPIDSAIRKLANGEETISGLRAEFKGLNNAPKEINTELNKCARLLENVKKIESKEGRTANWSAEYRKWSDEVDRLQAKLSVLRKQQASMTTPQVFKTSELRDAGVAYMTKVSNTINKQMPELQKMLNAHNWNLTDIKGIEDTDGKIKSLTLTVRDAEGALKQFVMQRAKLDTGKNTPNGLMQVGDVKILETASQAQEKFAQSTEKANAKLAEQANKIQLSWQTEGYQSKVDSLIAKTNQWVDVNGNARISTESLQTALNNLGTAYTNLNSSGGNTVANQQALIAAEEALNVEVKKVQSSVTSMNATMAKSTAVDALRQKVQMFYDTNSKAHWKWGKDLKSIMIQLASGAEVPITKMRQLEQEFIRIQNSARQAGKLGLSFFDTIKQGISKFSYWTSSTFLVMKTITSIKSAVSSVKELDTALVDLRKTTKMSASELENFYYKSNDVAKQMGVTTKEIITQAAAWSRLGFNTAESATEMAKLSAQFKMISPGMTLDEATDGLVSVMKAYGIEVNDVLDGIMSKINIIGNNKALNNSDIVDFLTRSSAAMASANNSLEETIALGEAAVEITRDASNAGQVLKTTSMRIRGIDEETETYSEDLEILKGKIADLTKTAKTPGGISLFTDETKQTYKSTYQILEEISNIWSDLTDKNQAQLLEVLAGKRNGQALAAIISNFDSARESMDLMANSAGNANAEMAIAMDSIEYKLNKLKETFTGVAQNLFKRDDMKSVVDFFTSIGKAIESVTEKLGLFGSIGIGAGLFAGIKNVGQVKMWTCLIYAYPC